MDDNDYAIHRTLITDISGNGSVDWEDFDLARQNVCRLNGWKSDMQVAIDAEETFKVHVGCGHRCMGNFLPGTSETCFETERS